MQHLKQDSASDISELPVLNVTAQMVLLCAWRTVKEVSLFLGELSEQAPISSAEDSDECHGKSLLTEEQVLTIGSHLAMLLVETKHRGAFEQAYVGFCKLCGRLWRHPSARLHNLPRLWMKELMDIITWGKGTKLCATRRSAGLPFMVQAFLTTELQVGGNTSCFRQSMAALLELADVTDNRAGARRSINAISGTATEDSVGNSTASDPSNIAENFKILYVSTESSDCVDTVEARIHALNILRSLFRHSVLGESVTPYIAQGVIVAIQGFKGKTWAERNSATLLFSALVTRIFGVHRSREELSIRNRMTGRIFFLRYPSLYEFLLEELKEAIASMEECYSSLQPGLFPVLLLLSRLYPSSLEGTDSNLQLSVYAPFVHRCSLSSVLKTRVLAAKALVPLVPPNQHPLLLQELVTISAQKYTTENHRHGLLLQIFHLLEESLSALSVSKEVAERVEQWIVDLKWLLPSETGFQICFVTSEVFLRILHIVSRRLFMSVSHSIWQEICNVLSVDLLRSQEEVPSRMIGRGIYLRHAVQLLLELSLVLHPTHTPTPSFLKDMEQLLVHLLFHARYEVVKIALSFLEALLDTGDYILEDEEDSTLPVDKSFYRHVKEWNRSHEGVLADSLRSSPAIGEILVRQMVPKEQSTFAECCWKTFCVLSHCPKALLRMETAAEGVLRGLLQRCQKECEGIDWAVLRCAGALVKIMQQENVPLTAEVTSEVCCTLVEFSSTDKSSTCRLTVANILLDNTSWLQGTMTFLSALDVCTLWTVVMTLLDDECSHVRELISSLAMHFGCTKFPVMPQRAKDLLVEYFVHVMINLDALMCVVCLVAWCLMSPGNDCDSGLLEDRVFDKGEMNEFAETVTVTEVACGQLKNLLCREDRTQLLETHLPGKVKDWLLHMCRTDMSTMSDCGESHTLAEFIKEADRRAVFSTGDSHFLCVNPRTEILTVFKTKKLMEAVHGSLGSK
ncbi:hypothetical protein B7P43_G05779 [Cryptotermes secundus]|nr:hypothetical protein B7P43_G05779 [Cryptotermes secundus]